jgi:hypothetical protein
MVSPKEPPGNERGEAGAWGLSVGAVSLTGRTNGVRYLTLAAADGQNCSVALMFIMRSTRAEKYRQEAARLRLEAERAKHPDISRQLLNIATQYDDLANSVERLSQSKCPTTCLWSGLARSDEVWSRHATRTKIGNIRRLV